MTGSYNLGNGAIFATGSSVISSIPVAILTAIEKPYDGVIGTFFGSLFTVAPLAIIFTGLGVALYGLPIAVLLSRARFLNGYTLSLAGFAGGLTIGYLGWVIPISFVGIFVTAMFGTLAGLFFWIGCREEFNDST